MRNWQGHPIKFSSASGLGKVRDDVQCARSSQSGLDGLLITKSGQPVFPDLLQCPSRGQALQRSTHQPIWDSLYDTKILHALEGYGGVSLYSTHGKQGWWPSTSDLLGLIVILHWRYRSTPEASIRIYGRWTWTDVAAACFPPFTSPPSLSAVYNSQTSTLFRHTSLPVTSSLHCSLILHCLNKCEIPPWFFLEVWFTRTGFDELTPTSSLSHPHFLPSRLDGGQSLCLILCFLHTGQ